MRNIVQSHRGRKSKHIHFDVQEGIDYLEVRTAKLIIRVYDNFMVDFYDVNGQLLCADYRGGRKFATQISEKFIEFLKQRDMRCHRRQIRIIMCRL